MGQEIASGPGLGKEIDPPCALTAAHTHHYLRRVLSDRVGTHTQAASSNAGAARENPFVAAWYRKAYADTEWQKVPPVSGRVERGAGARGGGMGDGGANLAHSRHTADGWERRTSSSSASLSLEYGCKLLG